MKIQYHKKFEKRYHKLSKPLKVKVQMAIQRFSHNPYDPKLRNHALSGNLEGLRSFSVTGDIRIIFEERDSYALVIFLDVGTHNQVY